MRTGPAELVYRPIDLLLRRVRTMPRQSVAEAISIQRRAHERALVLVRIFYGVSLVWTIQEMGSWPALRDVDRIDPQWPAAWIDEAAPHSGISLILLGFGLASVLVALWPESRTLRTVYFVGFLQYLSVKFGFGKVNHNMHAWLWVAGFLVLLPPGRRFGATDSRSRHRVLAVVWGAQVMVLFFYTLTGVWKVAYAVHALGTDRVSAFELEGFSLIIGERLLATNQITLLGEFFVANQFLGWALFNGTMYLEAASLLAALRPRLHRLWGGGLIAFHVGTQLTMGFTFTPNIALIALLLLASPWAPDRPPLREVFLDLPGVHFVANRVRHLRRARPNDPPGANELPASDDPPRSSDAPRSSDSPGSDV